MYQRFLACGDAIVAVVHFVMWLTPLSSDWNLLFGGFFAGRALVRLPIAWTLDYYRKQYDELLLELDKLEEQEGFLEFNPEEELQTVARISGNRIWQQWSAN